MDTISYIALTQVVFTILLLLSKRPLRVADKVLIVILLDVAFIITGSVFRMETRGDTIFRQISLVPFTILLLPLLFIYVKKSIVEEPVIQTSDFKHLVFPCFMIFAGIIYTPLSALEDQIHNDPQFNFASIFEIAIALIFLMFYGLLIYKQIKTHQKKLPDEFSYSSFKLTLNWILMVVALFLSNWLLSGLAMGINIYFGEQLINPGMVFFTILTLFSFMISYFGFLQPSIFQPDAIAILKNQKVELSGSNDQIEKKKKYQKSNLSENQAWQYIDQIHKYLKDEQSYLNPDLSIHTVARDLGLPKHHITESLNTYLGKNFYTLINEYRVDAFKEKVQSDDYSHWTLLAIAFDCGFSSKSSFNMVFKDLTGVTPSKYVASKKKA